MIKFLSLIVFVGVSIMGGAEQTEQKDLLISSGTEGFMFTCRSCVHLLYLICTD